MLLKICIHDHLNRIRSSRGLERERQRNLELMWLTGRLARDVKTIADFHRDRGKGIQNACRRFVVLCRERKLFSQAIVAIDGRKSKAVNNRDRTFTEVKIDRFQEQVARSIQREMDALETADRMPSVDMQAKTERLQERIKSFASPCRPRLRQQS